MNEYIFHIHISSLQSNLIKYFYYITPWLPKNVAICFFIPIVIYFWAFIKKIEKFTLALFRFTEQCVSFTYTARSLVELYNQSWEFNIILRYGNKSYSLVLLR